MTQNDDQSIMLEISKLVPWDQNPRLNDDAVDAVALSIQEFGWTNPILARAEDLMVIAGHTRLKAAKQLGLDVVPVRVLDVSETQAKQIAIADNKLGELAFWDETLLSELLAGFELEELGPLGFDENELEDLLKLTDPEQIEEKPIEELEDIDPDLIDKPIPTFNLLKGDCLERLKELPSNSIDSVVCDPPYEINFMSKGWDNSGIAFNVNVWQECLRVLKPGGHLIAFGGARTMHRITCAIEDAGFEIRDQICWAYYQGFPKSLDISKQIDKMAGAERQIVSASENGIAGGTKQHNGASKAYGYDSNFTITKPATPEAQKWDGWGTALKPSYEPAILARKPISEDNIAKNVLKFGTGAMNIDKSRFAYGDDCYLAGVERPPNGVSENNNWMPESDKPHVYISSDKGRWPANVYQCPKPPRSQKEAGLTHLKSVPGHAAVGREPDTAGLNNPRAGAGRTAEEVKNNHPTVKPIKLMRWLTGLVTPPNGTVLDPFLGSGTTAAASILEGFNVVGCEITEDYWAIIEGRVEHALKQWKIEQVSNETI